MEKQLLKKSGIIAVIITFSAIAFWLGFAKSSLGLDTSSWTPYAMKKNSVVSEQLIIMCGASGSGVVFGTTSGAWVGTPTDSTLARIGLNTGTGKLEIKNAGTDTASPIVKFHDDLADITPNQHHAQVHGAADHSGSIGTESQITFGTGSGHAHTGTDSTKVSYPDLLNRSHGAADHTGNIGTETQITFGSETGHAHTGTDSTKVSYPNLVNRSHGAADHSGDVGTESQITFGTASGHSHNGSDSTKIDYDTAPVQLGTDTAGNSDNISEGSTNKYHTDARVNAAVGSLSVNALSDVNIIFNENDFVKIVDGQLVAGSSSVTVAFSEVTGSPTDNANFKIVPGTSTVPVRDSDGNLFVSGIIGGTTTGAIRIPSGTEAQRPGTPTTGMLRLSQSKTSGEGSFSQSALATGGAITYTITGTGTTRIEYYASGTWTALQPPVTSPLYTTVHTFTSSSNLVIPGGTITVKALVVAGGGGGGTGGSGTGLGGGGAGGLLYNAAVSVSGTQTVTVGAGGASHSAGNDSVFASLTSVGGGFGAGGADSFGGTGGSGGGASGGNATGYGSGTASQGNRGGGGQGAENWASGGGGGAGAVGGAGIAGTCGTGGIGLAYTLSGSSVYYAGGGGGGVSYLASTAGSGGNGGGGAGGVADTAGTNGTTNTGGGGGGAGWASAVGGIGGSGIVIISYVSE